VFGCDGFVTGVALGRPCAEAMVESQPKVVRSTLTKGFSMGIFKDENGRSYGDWTHRGQGRTREQANEIVTTDDEKKWYEQTFWIIFFLVIFWPVGLVLMWRGSCTWHVAVKVVVTVVLLGVVVLSYQMSQAVLAAQGTLVS